MVSGKPVKQEGLLSAWRPTVLVLVAWTVVIGGSLAWNLYNGHHQTREMATKEARAHFDKDQAFRFWATRHGGVYVPADERTPPNPNLRHIPERDIETPSGKKLTLMNPAYMLRQMMNEFTDLYGVRGRITSMKYLNPTNAPDEWEKKALLAFENGVKEAFEFGEIGGDPYLRLMRPMVTQEGCLKCHGFQGYKVGDVRGGVGVSVPLAPYLSIQRWHDTVQVGTHAAIWLVGALAIMVIARRSRHRQMERLLADQALAVKSMELERANGELRRSNAEFRQFSYAVSHDLQEPLRGVVNFLTLLERRHKETLEQDAQECIRFAVDGAKRMSAMIHDLLEFSRVQSPNQEPEPVDTGELVSRALGNLSASIDETGTEVTVNAALPTVLGNAAQLARVFQNLIGNAVKYRDPSRPPRVILDVTPDGEEWVFSIADNGIGIEPQHFDRIFGVFQRLHGHDEYEGTGIGLALVKRIVEQHGGRIWVESEPGMGSRFLFSLPRRRDGREEDGG
jgi:signal transduction histidine kinase